MALVVSSLRPGSAEFRGSTFGFVVAWWKLAGSSAANEFGGPGNLLDGDCWKCCLLYGETQEEHLWNLILRER